MAAPELFPAESVAMLSPRLRFMERHNLTLSTTPAGRVRCSLTDDMTATGDDENEAIAEFCVKFQLKHYLEE